MVYTQRDREAGKHPNYNQLWDFAGENVEKRNPEIKQHVDGCSKCKTELEEICDAQAAFDRDE
jgi:hypothetical protein